MLGLTGQTAPIGGLNIAYETLVFLAIMSVVCWLLRVIAHWKIFTKAGEKGWKSLIPIYNLHVEFKLVWVTRMFWVLAGMFLGSSVLGAIASAQGTAPTATVGSTIMLIIVSVLSVGYLVVMLMLQHKLSKAFGHGIGFTIGLILLNPLFMLILGFGKSQYVGNTVTGAKKG